MEKKSNLPTSTRQRHPVFDANMLRLCSLCVLFFVVIYLMLTARKPESWAWMGFKEEPKKSNISERSESDLRPSVLGDVVINPEEPLIIGTRSTNQKQDDLESAESQPKFNIQLTNLSSKINSVEDDFWRQVYDRLQTNYRRDLFRLLRFAGNEITADREMQDRFGKIVKFLKTRRNVYQGQLFQHITSLPESQTDEKKNWSEVLFQIRTAWNDDYEPVLTARLNNKQLPKEQVEKALTRLRGYLEQQAFRDIRDGAPVGRAKEGVAWLMMWQNVMAAKSSTVEAMPVTQLELNSQPASYRGKQVKFRGFVRSARLQEIKDHELGIKQFYILWIKPEEKSTFPYCVYALDLPKDFPVVQRETVEMNEQIEVSGRFFKVRSYKARGGLRECPLVLTDTPTWFPQQDSASETSVVLPSWPVMVGSLFLIAFAAAGFAFWVYRATSSLRTESAATEAKVAKDFKALQQDPAVETVSDRLRKMSEKS